MDGDQTRGWFGSLVIFRTMRVNPTLRCDLNTSPALAFQSTWPAVNQDETPGEMGYNLQC